MVLESIFACIMGVVTQVDAIPSFVTTIAIILFILSTVLANKGSQTMFKQGERGGNKEVEIRVDE